MGHFYLTVYVNALICRSQVLVHVFTVQQVLMESFYLPGLIPVAKEVMSFVKLGRGEGLWVMVQP